MREKEMEKVIETFWKYDLYIKLKEKETKRLEKELKRLYIQRKYGEEYANKRIEKVKKGLI